LCTFKTNREGPVTHLPTLKKLLRERPELADDVLETDFDLFQDLCEAVDLKKSFQLYHSRRYHLPRPIITRDGLGELFDQDPVFFQPMFDYRTYTEEELDEEQESTSSKHDPPSKKKS
jgi:hypothetical protein